MGHTASHNTPARTLSPSMPLPAALEGVVAEHLKHLESLLDSILATVVIIQSVSTSTAIPISSHAQDALKLLHNLIPLAHTPVDASAPMKQTHQANVTIVPTCKSYAQATKDARPPPAGQQMRTRTPPKIPHPRPSRHSPHRLIVRWPGHPIPVTAISLDKFARQLGHSISPVTNWQRGETPPSMIAGANVTKSGNLVIHTAAPYTAIQLQERRTAIMETAHEIPDFDPPIMCIPELELDVPWHGVVVHDLPATSLVAAYEGDRGDDGEALGLWEALEKEMGISQGDIRDVRLLCRDEDRENRDRISLRIMMENPLTCDHLCRNGAFLLGTRCRVSRYRPRKSQRKPTSPQKTNYSKSQ